MLAHDVLGFEYDDSFSTDDSTPPPFIRIDADYLLHLKTGHIYLRESLRKMLHDAGDANAAQTLASQVEGPNQPSEASGWRSNYFNLTTDFGWPEFQQPPWVVPTPP